MDNESEVICNQMEETRSALTDKLESLEQQVTDTVNHATGAVTETVDSVKDAVRDTMDAVKETFDVRRQVERHPWALFLGAVVVGYVGTRLLNRALAPRQAVPVAPPVPRPAAALSGNGHTSSAVAVMPAAPTRTLWDAVADEYSEELDKIKGLAISTAGGILREMLTTSAPAPMVEQLKTFVDAVTVKLGGQPLEGSFLSPSLRPAKPKTPPKSASKMDVERMMDDGCPNWEPEGESTGGPTTDKWNRGGNEFNGL